MSEEQLEMEEADEPDAIHTFSAPLLGEVKEEAVPFEIAGEDDLKPVVIENLDDVLSNESLPVRISTPRHLVDDSSVLKRFLTIDNSVEEQISEFVHKINVPGKIPLSKRPPEPVIRDVYDFDGIDNARLLKKPKNFIVFGKPGVGCSTFARMFAKHYNVVHVEPNSSVRYFQTDEDITPEIPVYSRGLGESYMFQRMCERIQLEDAQDRGYILTGWPSPEADELSMEQQVELLRNLPVPPDFVFILQMHDQDLIKRRMEQKVDTETGQIYTRAQYMQLVTAQHTVHHKRISIIGEEQSSSSHVTSEFDSGYHQLVSPDIIRRLTTRLEDHPSSVQRQLRNFNDIMYIIQDYINDFDNSHVYEISSYWPPPMLMKHVINIMTAIGFLPSPSPKLLFQPRSSEAEAVRGEAGTEGDFDEEEDDGLECIPDPNDPDNKTETDEPFEWNAVYRAASAISRTDPRFRWEISRWKNLCPVALKEGYSKEGQPKLAYGYYDKMYFLSSEEYAAKFLMNPRLYLRPSMPTSPVKFLVIGHPLAGKTIFASLLAAVFKGAYIDMKREVKMWLEPVKQYFLFKSRFNATMHAKELINKELRDEWKRQEKIRRENIKQWIEEYTENKAIEALNASLAVDRESRMAKYRKYRYESEKHLMSDQGKSQYTSERLSFSWKRFVENIRKGVDDWPHQQKLELAWDLLKDEKLRYKKPPRTKKSKKKRPTKPVSYDEEAGEGSDSEDDDAYQGEGIDESGGEEELGEEVEINRKTKKRRKRRKKPYCKKATESAKSSIADEDSPSELSEGESDELIALRYPDMCPELTQATPKPCGVSEHNDIIRHYVEHEVKKTEEWLNTLPCEVYEEILQIVVREAENNYRANFPNAHLSGGWVLDNITMDVDKWRCILRNPKLRPDQIFLLQDTSENYSALLSRLPDKPSDSDLSAQLFPELDPEDRKRVKPKKESLMNLLSPISSQNFPVLPPDTLFGSADISDDETHQLEMDKHRLQSRTQSFEDFGRYQPRKSDSKEIADTPQDLTLYYKDPKQCHSLHELTGCQIHPASHEMILIEPSNRFAPLVEESYPEDPPSPPDIYMDPYSDPPSVNEFEYAGEGYEEGKKEAKLEPSGPPRPRAGTRKLLREIQLFNDAWNMIYPVVQEQKIAHWDVGLAHGCICKTKPMVKTYKEQLESRFLQLPTPVSTFDLEEYDTDMIESVSRWSGEEGTDSKEEPGEDDGLPDPEEDEQVDGARVGEDRGEGMGEEDTMPAIPSLLRSLEQKPDEFARALEEIERNRPFGNLYYYCPVSLVETYTIRKGNSRYAAKYQGHLYYLADKPSFDKFLANPKSYIKQPPHCIPPPRICITGSPGCNQFEVALRLSKQAKVYCISFREWLHGIIKSRLGRPVGPYHTGEIITQEDETDYPLSSLRASSYGEIGGEGDSVSVLPEDYNTDVDWIMDHHKRSSSPETADFTDDNAKILSYDIDDIELSEIRVKELQNYQILTPGERKIKSFLETGSQLPPEVLDKFIPQLWLHEPFKSKGFILTGFPNTADDIKYLQSRHFIPEKIYIVQCSNKTCRTRLIPAVMTRLEKFESQGRGLPKKPRQYKLDEIDQVLHTDHRPYQDTNLVKAGKVIYYHHYICTKDHFVMKSYMNQVQMSWSLISADYSLLDAEKEISDEILPRLLHRESIFEVTHILYDQEAEALLNSGYFQLSRFNRWCPVEISRGNYAVNLWSAPAVKKFPVLHRKFIYFIAGEDNLNTFCDQALKMVSVPITPHLTNPSFVFVLGHPKAGKTELAYRIANNLGLEYICRETIPFLVLQHSTFPPPTSQSRNINLQSPLPMIFANRLLSYLQESFTIPPYMMCMALNFVFIRPLIQFQGCVFDGGPMSDTYATNIYNRGITPALTVNLEIDHKTLLERVNTNRHAMINDDSDILEPSDDITDYEYNAFGEPGASCVLGSAELAGTLFTIDGIKNPAAIANLVAAKVIELQTGVKQIREEYCKSESTHASLKDGKEIR